MDWQALRAALLAQYADRPQHSAMIELALREARDGLDKLARLGHLFHLAPGAEPPRRKFPLRMFHANNSQGVIVYDEFALAELGEGWRDTLGEAQRVSGMRKQFMGRGGVQMSGMPAVIYKFDFEASKLQDARNRADQIAAFKARRDGPNAECK